MKTIIAPSILSMDFTNIKSEIKRLVKSKAEWIHYDIMDGSFVNNISFGIPVFQAIVPLHTLVNDVHLMIVNPKKYVEKFALLGADYITFHYEACKDDKEVFETIDLIHSFNVKAGISLRPSTPIEKILPFITSLDLVLVMSVEPGFGGQGFLSESVDRIKALKDYLSEFKREVLIEVDGGINNKTAKLVKDAGANVLVSGSYLFLGDDMKGKVKSLR